MIDLELYKIFKLVADEENLTRASKKLSISQPAVTKHIHNLEALLEIKLFERTKYGMKLTQDGKKLYAQVKEPISTLMSIEGSLKQTTALNLGIHTNMPKEIYRALIAKIEARHPNIEVSIDKRPTEAMFEMLESNEIDAYLSKRQPEDIHSKSIKFIKLGMFHDDFFVNSNSSFLRKDILKSKEKQAIYTLRNISSTSRNLEQMLKDYPNIEIKNATFNTIIEKMQNTDLVAYITEQYIKEELETGKLKKLKTKLALPPDVEYGIYYNEKNRIRNVKKLLAGISIDQK